MEGGFGLRAYHTKRLLLSQIHKTDVLYLFPIWTNPLITKYTFLKSIQSFDEALAMVDFLNQLSKTNKALRYTIFRKDKQEIIGSAGFNYICPERRFAEIGFEISPEHWGYGFGCETITALQDIAERAFHLNALQCHVHKKNRHSIRILTQLGFHYLKKAPDELFVYEKKINPVAQASTI